MAYNIAFPANYTFRIVFIWRRYSPPRKEPGVDYWELTYVLVYKSYRSIRFQNRLFPGSGRLHIVAEKYYKSGRADLTLLGSIPFQSHPSWCNLCLDINSVCNKYPRCTPTIFTTRPDEIGTCAFHMLNALRLIEFPKRVFIHCKHCSCPPTIIQGISFSEDVYKFSIRYSTSFRKERQF